MNFKKIIGLLFIAFNLVSSSYDSIDLKNIKHCLSQNLHHHPNRHDIQVFLHGKPIHIHVEGQPIQPVINVAINMTIIEYC